MMRRLFLCALAKNINADETNFSAQLPYRQFMQNNRPLLYN